MLHFHEVDDPFDGCDFYGNTGCPGVYPPFDYVPPSDAVYQERLGQIATQILDDLGAYNGAAVFVPGSLTVNGGTIPPGAIDNSSPTGGTNGDGLIDVSNIDVPASSEILIQYDVTLSPALFNGTVVTNQAGLYAAGNDIGGTDVDTYAGVVSRHSSGWAFSGGRIAGESAAAYVKSKK